MAESPLQKLQRLAAEKKAAAAATVASPVAPVASKPSIADQIAASGKASEPVKQATQILELAEGKEDDAKQSEPIEATEVLEASDVGTDLVVSSNAGSSNSECLPRELETATPSSHPLAMQFAEMEAALLADDPQFKVLLRDVHRHLGNEPELVTMMSEEEVALVVRGMVQLANAEIIDPAKAKKAKALTAEAKKKVITVDDL